MAKKVTRQSKSNKSKTMPIVQQKGVGPLKDDFTIYRSLRNLFSSQSEVLKPYSQSVWVYATIRSIAMNIARTPFVAYQGKYGDAESKEVIEWPEEYSVLKKPNPFMSMEILIEAVSTYLDLRGEAFLILEGRENVAQIPKEIWTFDPLRFEPIFDSKGKILLGWKYSGVEDVVFGLHEIIQIKYFNPYDDYRGLSPLTAATTGIDQEYFANQYNRTFFKEGAPTGGFIQYEEGLNDIQYNRLLNQFEDRHKGANKAHRIGILEGGGKFIEARISQKDMDFIEMKKMGRTEIFAVYKANPVAMGIYEDIKSYEGVKEARKSFWQECIIPRQELIVNTLWWSLFGNIGNRQIWGEFNRQSIEALQEDFEKKLASAERMAIMGWPINAINKKLGLGMDDVPWGDVTWKPLGMMSVSSGEATSFPSETIPSEQTPKGLDPKKLFMSEIKSVPEKYILPAKFTLIKKTVENKNIVAEVHWKIFLAKQIPLEKIFYSKVKRFLFEQRSRVLEKLHSSLSKDVSDEIFNEDFEVKAMQKLIRPLYELSLKDGAEMAAEQVGSSNFVFNPLDKDFLGYMQMRITKIPRGMVETIKDQLRDVLTQGITAGEGVNELAERVKGVYNMASSRALTIARTESASSINAGRFIQLEKEGVEKHEWITALDEAVRDSHKALEGSIAIIGEEFDYGGKGGFSGRSGLRYPGDMQGDPGEVINCFIDQNTPILCSDGFKGIGQIKIGDKVLTHKGKFKHVRRIYRGRISSGSEVVRIVSSNKSLTITPEHRLLTQSGWKEARHISIDDSLMILSVPCARCNKPIPYYNKYCSISCCSLNTTDRQWSDPQHKHRKNISEKASRQMHKEYRNGTRNRFEITQKARKVCYSKYGNGGYLGIMENKEKKFPSIHPPEIHTEKMLKQLKKEYCSQFWLEDINRRVDFYLPQEKKFIECDDVRYKSSKDLEVVKQRDVEILLQYPDHTIEHRIYRDGLYIETLKEIDLLQLNHSDSYLFTSIPVIRVEKYRLKNAKSLYNFSVEGDESYLAKGIVSHNCRCVTVPVIKK